VEKRKECERRRRPSRRLRLGWAKNKAVGCPRWTDFLFSDKQPRGEAGVAQQRQPGQSHSSPNIIPYRPGKNTFGTVDQGAFAAKSVSA